MTTGRLPFLLAEATARMVLGGPASELRARTLAELAARHAAAFAGYDFRRLLDSGDSGYGAQV